MTRTTLVAIALASGLVGAWALGNQRPLIAVALLALSARTFYCAYRIPA